MAHIFLAVLYRLFLVGFVLFSMVTTYSLFVGSFSWVYLLGMFVNWLACKLIDER